jgi:tRNA(Arg) A34 adenosine deaminase TadA
MIPASYKPKKKFMELAIAEAKLAGDRGDYPIGAVITRLVGKREVVIASAGNRVKTSGSSIKHVELETLKYVCSGYGRYLPDFVFNARALRDVRGRLCVVQNRRGGLRRFAGRHCRVRP